LLHGQARDVRERMRDDHMLHAELACALQHCQYLIRMDVPGSENEILPRDDLEDRFHLGCDLAVGRDLDALCVLGDESLEVLVGLEGRQPYDFPAAAVHAM